MSTRSAAPPPKAGKPLDPTSAAPTKPAGVVAAEQAFRPLTNQLQAADELRRRRGEIGVSQIQADNLAGFSNGYFGKLEKPGAKFSWQKISFDLMSDAMQALGGRLGVLWGDPDALPRRAERDRSDWKDRIARWLTTDLDDDGNPVPRPEPLLNISVDEALAGALNIDSAAASAGDRKAVGIALKSLGYRHRYMGHLKREWRYTTETVPHVGTGTATASRPGTEAENTAAGKGLIPVPPDADPRGDSLRNESVVHPGEDGAEVCRGSTASPSRRL